MTNGVRNKRISIVKVLIIGFSVLAFVSLTYLYYVHQQPILEKRVVTAASYVHRAMYDYVAELKPNIIYNKTILRSGEGILYITLTDKINVSFTYIFSSSPQPEAINVTMRRMTAKIESPDKWTKVLQKEELSPLLNLNFESPVNFTLEVNCTLLRQTVSTIDKELGVYSSSYNVYIVPEVLVDARIAGRSIREVYAPQLIIMFRTTADKGGYISLEGLEQTQSREVKDVIEVSYPEVENQRTLSYVATTLTAVGLAASAMVYHRVTWHTRKRSIDVKVSKMIKEHKDVIVEALTSLPEAQTVIEVSSLEDLVKVAEILAKPILKAMEGEKQVFYVMDENIKYQYKMQGNKASKFQ